MNVIQTTSTEPLPNGQWRAIRTQDGESIIADGLTEMDALDALHRKIHVMPDIVDAQAIADRLGVKRETVWMWRSRHLLPPPDWQLACGPIWLWQTIEQWARETGRTQ